MKKKESKAVALKYQIKQDRAPMVVAKGQGLIAEKIIALAEQNKIKVHQDETLTNLLLQMEVMQEIPEDLYQIVAEVFAFIYRLDQRK